MMDPFAAPLAWFLWWNTLRPQEPLQKRSDKASIKGLSIKVQIKQEINLFFLASLLMPTIAHSPLAMVANMASFAAGGPP